MSGVKHQPATPLPLGFASQRGTIVSLNDAIPSLDIARMHMRVGAEQDGVYLTHAGNAYQKLVEALQSEAEQVYAILCSDGGGDIPARITAAQEHVSKWRALLRDLGEQS